MSSRDVPGRASGFGRRASGVEAEGSVQHQLAPDRVQGVAHPGGRTAAAHAWEGKKREKKRGGGGGLWQQKGGPAGFGTSTQGPAGFGTFNFGVLLFFGEKEPVVGTWCWSTYFTLSSTLRNATTPAQGQSDWGLKHVADAMARRNADRKRKQGSIDPQPTAALVVTFVTFRPRAAVGGRWEWSLSQLSWFGQRREPFRLGTITAVQSFKGLPEKLVKAPHVLR